MASDRISIDQMASVIMEGLQDYADLATDDLKAYGCTGIYRK